MARALAGAALVAAAVACATEAGNQISEGHAGAPGVRRVLLCPLNLVLALRPEIQRGAKPVDDEIVAYLESRSLQLERLGLIEGRKLWKQSVAEAKALGSVARGAQIFVSHLAQDHEFDVVVMPSLLLHQERMDNWNASWDGVTRRMTVANAPESGQEIDRPDSTYDIGIMGRSLSGPVWVTSLHVLVFDRNGARIFEGRGGMELTQEVELGPAKKKYESRLRPRGALFEDRIFLREGVARAFTPFLTPPDA